MTKYQMIFVKIEVYLVNFKQIVSKFNYPLVRIAFSRIRLLSHSKTIKNAHASLLVVGKLKKVLTTLVNIEKKKSIGALCKGFSRIKGVVENERIYAAIKLAKQNKIKLMKDRLLDKKEEIENLNCQIEDNKAAAKSKMR